MSRKPVADITLSPAQVVALGERARSNQEALGSGCVCSHGCKSCDRLAEAFEAMREALKICLPHVHQMAWNKLGEEAESQARAALKLADEVRRAAD